MKRLYILFFALIALTSNLFADAEFYLKINKPGKYEVYLNNESINSKKNIFRFFDLSAGNYQLKVVQRNGWQQQIVYQENLFLQNGFRYVAELTPNFGLHKIAQIPFVEKNWYIDQLSIQNNWNNQNPQVCPTPAPPHTCTPNCNSSNCTNNNWNNNNNNNYAYYQNMDNTSFQNLKNVIKNTTFDDSKIQIVETALRNTYIQTNQVKELLSQITFESNRLKLAKFCYDKTTDKQNYFDVYNVFTFSSSVNELNKYIASR
jgi:nuclear transport factor 2 (NTF2) superfamily protein